MTSEDICKICHCGSEESGTPLITPCLCAGSIKFVHQECLMKWMKSSTSKTCELCKHEITTKQKLKPFTKWERATGTGSECGNLLRKACGLIIVAILETIVLFGWVQSTEFNDGPLRDAAYYIFLTLGVILILGITLLLCFMCLDGIMILEKWMAQNTMVVVQEIAQV